MIDCVEFSGPINRDGYGFISTTDDCVLAHRVAWERDGISQAKLTPALSARNHDAEHTNMTS